MSWETDDQGRKVFKVLLDSCPKDNFQAFIKEVPPTGYEWLALLYHYASMVSDRDSEDDPAPFECIWHWENREEFLARLEAAESGSEGLSPDLRQAVEAAPCQEDCE